MSRSLRGDARGSVGIRVWIERATTAAFRFVAIPNELGRRPSLKDRRNELPVEEDETIRLTIGDLLFNLPKRLNAVNHLPTFDPK